MNTTPLPDSFSFGLASGFCFAPDCAKFFLIKNEKLYADNTTLYTGIGSVAFRNSPEPDASYQIANQLLKDFPSYVTNSPNKSFGCPNCADQGQVVLTMEIGGKTTSWNVDTNVDALPQEIRSYLTEVDALLSQLN